MTNHVVIRDINEKTIAEFVLLCIPERSRTLSEFIEGQKLKEEWARETLKRYGFIAKGAFYKEKLIGFIQFTPDIDDNVLEINCIFVPDKNWQHKGIGKSLLNALIDDVNQGKYTINGKKPNALVTWAFEVPGHFPQHKFYRRYGFIQIYPDDPFWLYYPILEGYRYTTERPSKQFHSLSEDRGRALIFINPNCPFAIYFGRQFEKIIREVSKDIPVEYVNTFTQSDEVKKRGAVPFCVINGVPIHTFVTESDKLKAEIQSALQANN